MLATILHADLDAFYASVEQLLDPSLRGKPIAVGGGVVLAASYEAKAFGVKGGMPGRRARELCPHLIFVGGHFKEYSRLGDAAMKVLDDFTPLVERISIDEAFADVVGCTHLFGSPAEIAQQDPAAREERARAADLGRRGAHQAPGQDRLAGRQARRAGRGRSREGTGVPARPAGRPDVGRRTGHARAPGRAWRHDHRPAGQYLAARARSPAGSGGRREASGAGVEPRSARDPHAPSRAVGRRAVGAGPQARRRAHLPAGARSSRRPHRHAAARQVAGRPHRDGARALRRPARRHALADARRADRRDREPDRDRRGAGAHGAGRSSEGEAHLPGGDLGVASGEASQAATGILAGRET